MSLTPRWQIIHSNASAITVNIIGAECKPKGSIPSMKCMGTLPLDSQETALIWMNGNQTIRWLDIRFCKKCPFSKDLGCTGYPVHWGIQWTWLGVSSTICAFPIRERQICNEMPTAWGMALWDQTYAIDMQKLEFLFRESAKNSGTCNLLTHIPIDDLRVCRSWWHVALGRSEWG